MNKYLKDLPKAIIISFSIFLILLLIEVIAGYQVQFNYGLLTKFLYTMLYGITLFYANGAVFDYLDSFYKDNRFPPKRLIIGSLASFSVSVAVIFLLRIFEDVIVENQSFAEYIKHEKPGNYLVAIIITFVVTLALHAFHFYKAYQENRLKEQKIIAGTASAKFESLKNQIDPHFLFNSLNVLSSLIEENPDNAQKFTTSLSKIYRYVLEQKDKELVTVQEELAFAKTYMNLLKMRFENSITFELPENFENIEAKVVPLSLQLLLENTIKHNVVSEQKPLHIRIFVKDNYLIVQNDLQKKEVLQDRRGVGLQNIISRYGILTNRKVLIESTESIFAVHLPILTKQITTMEATYKTNENTAYYKAKKRVEELKGFYGNLIAYCIVIPILVYVNLTFVPEFHWFWFSAGGWGFGLLMHAFRVFGYSSDWENRKIKEILEKEQTPKNWK